MSTQAPASGPAAGALPEPLGVAEHVMAAPPVRALAEAMASGRRSIATGAAGSSTTYVAASVARLTGKPVLLVVAHLDDADEIEGELESEGRACVVVPALEAGAAGVSPDLLAQRLAAIRRLGEIGGDDSPVIVCPMASLMQLVPAAEAIDKVARRVRTGDVIEPGDLASWLGDAGYRRLDAIEEPGDFAVRGGIVDVFPPGGLPPVRLDFFGDEIDSMREIDLETMGSDRKIDEAELVAADPERVMPTAGARSVLESVPERSVVMIAEPAEVIEQGRGYYERATDATSIVGPPAVMERLEKGYASVCEVTALGAAAGAGEAAVELGVEVVPEFSREIEPAMRELRELAAGAKVVVACRNEGERARLRELATAVYGHGPEDAGVTSRVGYVHRGFVWSSSVPGGGDDRLVVVPMHELLHRFEAKRRTARFSTGRAMDTFLDLQPGDYVVHQDHGIARFAGLETLSVDGTSRPAFGEKPKKDGPVAEYLTLEFAGSSALRVPAAQIDLVQKYVGGFSGKPPLSKLGGAKWKAQKERVAESVRDLAAEMLRVRAAREHLPGVRYPEDTAWQKEFEAEFPYEETEDQLAALSEIKRDMTSERPMDRLVCGDVGFGKTEVAIRAAFKACEFGKQVAVLVPTTVLAEQHERTFRSRFASYPFRVESLSRFKTTQEINQTLAKLRRGEVDVIIGTHRLLSKDVKFGDLGLVIIDEEQRFGVEHKERLLQLRMTVDVLTLSATPIPRTLHMSMLGLRDISSLTTAPVDRRAVVTEVIPYNKTRVQRAIERELAREGQVYFVHNRVHNIKTVADDIQQLVPGARIVVGHGQMPPKELEQVMLRFTRREADVLVATTIIESGIDNPSANTMLINDADRFGLADLHQLRGRVGRYKHRAYCYMLLAPDRTVSEVARKRLKAIEQYSMLGAGFKISMRDLEIRGAGNLLGSEQSGHIAAVGYEMFCRLLESAVKELREPGSDRPLARTTLELGDPGLIPRAYIPSEPRRLEAYRRLATAETAAELQQSRADLTSAYGDPPKAVERLIDLAALRIAAAALGVRTLTVRGGDVVLLAANPWPAADALQGAKGTVRVVDAALAQTKARGLKGEELAEVYYRPPASYLEPASLVRVLTKRLSEGAAS